MAQTYPPPAPSLADDALTINRFLKEPTAVARRLRTIGEQRLIGDILLPQRFTTESGSVQFETGESIYSEKAPEPVAPGSEYPLTPVGNGDVQMASTVKWGRDAEITDESISRRKANPVETALLKLANHQAKTIDSVALAAVASAVTQASAASASWVSGTPNILRDVLKAVANIRSLNEGFEPDVVVVDDLMLAHIMSDEKIAPLLPRESKDSPIFTGNMTVIAGLRFVATPNLPTAGVALVADTKQLGGMADENLASPGYVAAGNFGQVKTMREDKSDMWRVRCRRTTVPIVLEPKAAWKITGVAA